MRLLKGAQVSRRGPHDGMRIAMRHAFYLHGFASSAGSSKAAFFRTRLAGHGVPLHCPDFNEPDFSTLTVTRMLAQLDEAIAALAPGPIVLIGSSLGGFLAVLAAARARPRHPIDRLILLAPALDFGRNGMRHLGEAGLADWERTNRLEVFHYGYGRTLTIGYELYRDAARYDAFAEASLLPMLIVQGRRDVSVPPETAIRFAASRPHVTLTLLDDDHQLLGSLEAIWLTSAAFLGLEAGPAGGISRA
jgi:pimeloyl-ACP methyl ester carboxylesterase